MGFYRHHFGLVAGGIVGDVGFDDSYSDGLWRGQQPLAVAYTPPIGSMLAKAAEQWQLLQDVIDLRAPSAKRAQARLSELRSYIGDRVAHVQQLKASGFDFQRDPIAGGQVASAYQEINSELSRFCSEPWVDAVTEIDATAQQAEADRLAGEKRAAAAVAAKKVSDAAAAETRARREGTQAAILDAQAAVAAAQKAKLEAQAAGVAHQQALQVAVEKRAALATPLTAAAIAVPLAIVAFLAWRSSRKSVAGYKRRRR